jgi:hypothetical protein
LTEGGNMEESNEYLSNAEKMDTYCDVMRSRYGREFVKTFLNQCAQNGIRETIYRSKPDSSERKLKFGAFLAVPFWWNDPDYPTETAYCVSAIQREQSAISAEQPKTAKEGKQATQITFCPPMRTKDDVALKIFGLASRQSIADWCSVHPEHKNYFQKNKKTKQYDQIPKWLYEQIYREKWQKDPPNLT